MKMNADLWIEPCGIFVKQHQSTMPMKRSPYFPGYGIWQVLRYRVFSPIWFGLSRSTIGQLRCTWKWIVWAGGGLQMESLGRMKLRPSGLPSNNWLPCTAHTFSLRIPCCFH